jgi:phosphocarrier protein
MSAEVAEVTLTLINPTGLHARPAKDFVQTANRFVANIRVQSGARTANAKSIFDVLQLQARQGAQLTITAEGADANTAIAALTELVNNRFGEGA